VASEGLSVKTKAGGAFQLVLGSTQIKQSSQITQTPSIAWNPSKCLFSWSGFSSGIVFRVLDLSGRIMTRYESPKNVTGGTFSFAGMRSGIYLATINGQGKTDSYRIVNLSGAIGNYDISISPISGNGGLKLAKAAATLKSHVLIFTKPGYKTYTVAVAAGTPSSPGLAMKMCANTPGGIPTFLPIVLFDGVTLNGWSGNPDIWSVKDSSIYGKAAAGHQQSLIITDQDYDNYRLFLTLREVVNEDHMGVSFGSTRSTKMDNSRWDYNGCSVFMPPFEWTWDYQTNGGISGIDNTLYNNYANTVAPSIDPTKWHTAELLMHVSKGIGSMAVDGVLAVTWNNPKKGYKASPIGLQAHDGALEIEHKNISIEVNPSVDHLITLK
jgi:hypothetical protein